MRDATEILVLGAGGHGKEVASYLHDLSTAGQPVRFLGFIDDHKPKAGEVLGRFDEIPAILQWHAGRELRYIAAVGDNRLRSEFAKRAEAAGLAPWSLIHPGVSTGRNVTIGDGTLLAPGSIVTTDVRIGRHCILNVKASVSHDAVVGDFANLNPGSVLCGNVRVGTGCFIGAGATVIEKVTIGDWTVVGAGAVVLEELPPGVIAVGVPARIIRRA